MNTFGEWRDSGKGYKNFYPNPLPAHIPMSPAIMKQAKQALASVTAWNRQTFARSDNTSLLCDEAIHNSLIENIDPKKVWDGEEPPLDKGWNEELQNCIDAMQYSIVQMRSVPLGRRVILDHHRFLTGGQWWAKPGQLRTEQVYVGGPCIEKAIYVPPPAEHVKSMFHNLEDYIAYGHDYNALIRAAILHVQFESIHPFLDGNGRTGRWLIGAYLYQQGEIDQPLFPISSFFWEYRKYYYDFLTRLEHEGDWQGWFKFFLEGVAHAVKVGKEVPVVQRLPRKK